MSFADHLRRRHDGPGGHGEGVQVAVRRCLGQQRAHELGGGAVKRRRQPLAAVAARPIPAPAGRDPHQLPTLQCSLGGVEMGDCDCAMHMGAGTFRTTRSVRQTHHDGSVVRICYNYHSLALAGHQSVRASDAPLPGRTWLNILAMVTSVVRFCFCLAALSSGTSSSRFLECTQNRLRPMLKGLHSGSVT